MAIDILMLNLLVFIYFRRKGMSAKKFLTEFPERRCDSISSVISGLRTLSDLTPEKSEGLSNLEVGKISGTKLMNLYFKHFDRFFEPYEDNCHRLAKRRFDMYYFTKKYDYYDNDMNNYLQFVCEKYNSYCSLYWERFYRIPYIKNDKVVNELHKELCSRWPRLRMCSKTSNLITPEYNNMIEKIRESGDRSEMTSFANLDTDKAY